MTQSFQPKQLELTQNQKTDESGEIIKLEASQESKGIQEYRFEKIAKPGDGDYLATKKKFGPLAATDEDRKIKTRKDARFSLNPIVKGPLAVEDEEKERIEERVAERVEAVRESVREEARVVGHKEGFDKGFEEAFAKYREDGARRLEKINELIAEFEGAKDEIYRQNERFLVELCLAISKKVIKKDISENKDYIVRIAKDIIERVGVKDNIVVKINSDDQESMARLSKKLEEEMTDLRNLKFEISDQVKSGGCIVESRWNAIDASIENQLRAVSETLIGKQSTEEVEEEGSETSSSEAVELPHKDSPANIEEHQESKESDPSEMDPETGKIQ